LVATPWTRVSTQTSLIAVGPCGKDDSMQTQCLADARFGLVHECFVQVLRAHASTVPVAGQDQVGSPRKVSGFSQVPARRLST
jgi:hypothetical protein